MATFPDLLELDPDDFMFDERQLVAGSGGFGEVWFGYHRVMKRTVAVKLYRVTGGPADRGLIVNTIQEEIKHLNKVNHENIVQVLGWVHLEHAVGIVMEHCSLGNLKTLLLDRRIQLGVLLLVRFLLNIAKALECCHSLPEKRLIHGDIKPENILLSIFLIAKLCDFGNAELATVTGSTAVDPLARSKKDRQQYTLHYTAPEKLHDLTMRPTKELDIYAFGLIIHMVLSREMPYPRCNQRALLDAIKRGQRPNCQAIQEWKNQLIDGEKAIVEVLEQIMKQCWDENPCLRPSMTEICSKLDEIFRQHRTSVFMHQAANVLEQLEEINPPANVNHSITLNQLWVKKHGGNFAMVSRGTPVESSHREIEGLLAQSQEPNARRREGAAQVTENLTPTTISEAEVTKNQSTSDVMSQPGNTRERAELTENGIQQSETTSSLSGEQHPHLERVVQERAGYRSGTASGVTAELQQQYDVEMVQGQHVQTRSTENCAAAFHEETHSLPPSKQTTDKANIMQKTPQQPVPDRNINLTSLRQNYVDLLNEEKFSEADETTNQYLRSLGGVGVSAEDFMKTGDKRREDGNYLEAILFYNLSSELYVKHSNGKTGAEGVKNCVEGLKLTSKYLLAVSPQLRYKQIVREHVIPLMEKMRLKIKNMKDLKEKRLCLCQVWCLNWIGFCQDLIGDYSSSETPIKLGLEMMKEQFGANSAKHKVFGYLLSKLGVIYEETNRLNGSVDLFKRAIEALRIATDLSRQNRQEKIQRIKNNLQRVETLLGLH